ncbi:uncharacterized protein [Ptychodera flava]|uniref:uncharacterized protein n=1 Tax=Ptychodera flava TaxID=63121 RepID=UPI00396AA8DB
MLVADAVPTIQLRPPTPRPTPTTHQDQGAHLSPHTPRAAAAKRERKRLVALAVSSLQEAASAEPTVEPEPTIPTDESPSVISQPEQLRSCEMTHPLSTDKKIQTLKYTPPCEKCSMRPRHKSIGVQCDLPVPLQSQYPTKRKRKAGSATYDQPLSDIDEEMEISEGEDAEEEDPNYGIEETHEDGDISDSENDTSGGIRFDEVRNDGNEDLHKQRKYIVFESSLMALFALCTVCRATNTCHRYVCGTLLKVRAVCNSCGNKQEWCNQPFIRNIPTLNLLLNCAILFSGSLPRKALRMFSFLNIQCHTTRTYFHHQASYMYDAIATVWKKKQDALFTSLRHKELILGGDARCDSMGHSAKYGSYNLMELNVNKVLIVQLVQSNEVGSSYGMELEGLKRCRQELEAYKDVEVKAIITDRHRQVAKWIRENWTNVTHYFDCWHIVKGLCKKLMALAKNKNMSVLKEWIMSIKCHLYWCALSSTTAEEKKKKWLACVDHIQNVHENCSHPPITRDKLWLLPGTEVNVKVVELLTKTMFVNDVQKMSHHGQTSGVEAYHSIVNHFVPKMYTFSYKGMCSRVRLAAMHYNENAGRGQKVTREGANCYSIAYPKYKNGGYSLKKVLVEATYGYVHDCFSEVLKLAKHPKKRRTDVPRVEDPPFLTAALSKPDKETVIAEHCTRFRENYI